MIRLTLRSHQDGRFLARIIDRDGFPFVLDFGERRMIEDAVQRLQHGFTMWQHGKLLTAHPKDPDLVVSLAHFYAGEGLLVFLEEPTWVGRGHSLEDRLPGPDLSLTTDEPDELTDLLEPCDDQTDLVEVDDPPGVELSHAPALEPAELADQDLETEERPWLEEEILLRARLVDADGDEPQTELLDAAQAERLLELLDAGSDSSADSAGD